MLMVVLCSDVDDYVQLCIVDGRLCLAVLVVSMVVYSDAAVVCVCVCVSVCVCVCVCVSVCECVCVCVCVVCVCMLVC